MNVFKIRGGAFYDFCSDKRVIQWGTEHFGKKIKKLSFIIFRKKLFVAFIDVEQGPTRIPDHGLVKLRDVSKGVVGLPTSSADTRKSN